MKALPLRILIPELSKEIADADAFKQTVTRLCDIYNTDYNDVYTLASNLFVLYNMDINHLVNPKKRIIRIRENTVTIKDTNYKFKASKVEDFIEECYKGGYDLEFLQSLKLNIP